MFFPFIGLSLAVTWAARLLLDRLRGRLPSVVPAVAATMVLMAFGYGVHVRNQVWHDDVSLWHDVTVKSPHNGRGLMNYGLALMIRGDTAAALNLFESALTWAPNYDLLEINLGIANGALGRDNEAEAHFQRAVSLAPGDSAAHYYYARWLEQKGRKSDAIAQVRTALDLNALQPGAPELAQKLEIGMPQTAEQWLELSLSLYREQRYMESVAAAQNAVNLRPDYAEAYNNIGAAYGALHLWDAAIKADAEAVRLKPDLQLARNNLAWAQQQKQRQSR